MPSCSLQDIFVWFIVIYVQVSSSSFPTLRTLLVSISHLDFPEDLNTKVQPNLSMNE